MMTKVKDFNSLVKEVRLMRGLTLTELGNLIGSDAPHMSRVENNFMRTSPQTLERIFKALRVNLFYSLEPSFGIIEKKSGQVFIFEPETSKYYRVKQNPLKDNEHVEFFVDMNGEAEIVGRIDKKVLQNPLIRKI